MRICDLALWLGMACVAAASQEHKISVQKYVVPQYPAIARAANVSGEVKTLLSLAPDGYVTSVSILAGHPMLKESAETALRQWKFNCDNCQFGESYQHPFSVVYCLDQESEFPDQRFTIHFSESMTIIIHADRRLAVAYGERITATKRPWFLRWMGKWKQSSETYDEIVLSRKSGTTIQQPCV